MQALKYAALRCSYQVPRRYIQMRPPSVFELKQENKNFKRKVFSGIQPTGTLHLGNYLGAIKKWEELQNSKEDVTFCIVDMHSITLPKDPNVLRENIFEVAATLLACGIDFNKSTVFVQSAVKEHTELGWILSCFSSMARLGHLPQYKEKTRSSKDIPLGLFVYPVLQAADILLHKATHVPVGEDQVQHIQLAQHLAKTFNTRYGSTFPICKAVIEDKAAARIRSLRDPTKKMSKSDQDTKASIKLTDEPEEIVEKVKKALTDFISDVKYDPGSRPGVSNLISIHSLMEGRSIKEIVDESSNIDTGKYKLRVADAVVEHLRPIRARILHLMRNRHELAYLLESGAEKASTVARDTMLEVKNKIGLGADLNEPPPMEIKPEIKEPAPAPAPRIIQQLTPIESTGKPIVPKQPLRIEKKRASNLVTKFETNMSPFKPLPKSTLPINTNRGQRKNMSTSLIPQDDVYDFMLPDNRKY